MVDFDDHIRSAFIQFKGVVSQHETDVKSRVGEIRDTKVKWIQGTFEYYSFGHMVTHWC